MDGDGVLRGWVESLCPLDGKAEVGSLWCVHGKLGGAIHDFVDWIFSNNFCVVGKFFSKDLSKLHAGKICNLFESSLCGLWTFFICEQFCKSCFKLFK